jgi:hypothetical protein
MMKNKEVVELIEKYCPNAVLIDEMDDCIVGVQITIPNYTNVFYSKQKVIYKLISEMKLTYEDATKFFNEQLLSLKFAPNITFHFVEERMKFNYN